MVSPVELWSVVGIARLLKVSRGRVRWTIDQAAIKPSHIIDGGTPAYDAAAVQRIRDAMEAADRERTRREAFRLYLTGDEADQFDRAAAAEDESTMKRLHDLADNRRRIAFVQLQAKNRKAGRLVDDEWTDMELKQTWLAKWNDGSRNRAKWDKWVQELDTDDE